MSALSGRDFCQTLMEILGLPRDMKVLGIKIEANCDSVAEVQIRTLVEDMDGRCVVEELQRYHLLKRN